MAAPIFSLVLATYGRVDEIGRLMDSLAAQTCADFELIFADQNPDERVLPFVERARVAGWRYQHLRLAEPNLSAARNAGMQVAQGDWLAIPDDDCWYEPDTLARVLERVSAPPLVDGIVIRWVEVADKVAAEDDSPLRAQAWRRFRGADASSIALFIRTDLARRVGGFDERLGVGQWYGAGEETDFLLRMLDVGAAIERLPAACVHHEFGQSYANEPGAEYRLARSRARGWGAICVKHRLPAWTVLRGLIGPLLWPVLRQGGPVGVARAAGVLIGRWQGFLAWRSGPPPAHPSSEGHTSF